MGTVKMKPTSTIKLRLGINPNGRVQSYLTQTCYKHMSKFVPGGTKSHLNREVDVQTDKIIYQSAGANYLFNGKLYVDPKYGKGAFYNEGYGYWSRPGITKIPTGRDLNYHTPGTGPHWDKLMMTSDGKEVIKEVQEYANKKV